MFGGSQKFMLRKFESNGDFLTFQQNRILDLTGSLFFSVFLGCAFTVGGHSLEGCRGFLSHAFFSAREEGGLLCPTHRFNLVARAQFYVRPL
jgi:hypothetical protein